MVQETRYKFEHQQCFIQINTHQSSSSSGLPDDWWYSHLLLNPNPFQPALKWDTIMGWLPFLCTIELCPVTASGFMVHVSPVMEVCAVTASCLDYPPESSTRKVVKHAPKQQGCWAFQARKSKGNGQNDSFGHQSVNYSWISSFRERCRIPINTGIGHVV